MNILSSTIDLIIANDIKDTSDKNIPVKHFFIDFRNMLLKPKLEKLMGGKVSEHSEFDICNVSEDGLSLFELCELINIINEAYGEEIENQTDLRHVIDAIFDKNSWIMRYQFRIFALGFFLPFVTQLFFTN
jgi:hypothetical protein